MEKTKQGRGQAEIIHKNRPIKTIQSKKILSKVLGAFFSTKVLGAFCQNNFKRLKGINLFELIDIRIQLKCNEDKW